MADEQKELVGLDHLNDEALAAFFEHHNGSRDDRERALALVAFEELCSRSGRQLEH